MRRAMVGALLVAVGCERPDTVTRAPDDAGVTVCADVAWAPWRRATFSRARAEHKLILVNVVATWCHWCHGTRALFDAALQWYEPRALLETSAPGARYPDFGKPAVYLCTETACSTPITIPSTFAKTADAFVRSWAD